MLEQRRRGGVGVLSFGDPLLVGCSLPSEVKLMWYPVQSRVVIFEEFNHFTYNHGTKINNCDVL